MPRLCALALDAGIETATVQRLIRRYEWKPPQDRPESWPWPVRIYALGGFRVLIDERPLTFTHKTPRKPIALLKAILAFGGQEVPVSRLVDALWPDDDGDSAYHSFGLTLHRLRKLLGRADAVLLSDGKVSLNDEIVWTDVSLCERALSSNPAPGGIAAALRLYRGPFLADADESPWTIARREQLRRKLKALAPELGPSVDTGAQPVRP
jgi:DNA-binding SARP family transcriptional activator